MPKSRPRSTNKAQWSSDTLSKAEDLINEGSSIRQAAKCMDIPFSSLQKRLKKRFLGITSWPSNRIKQTSAKMTGRDWSILAQKNIVSSHTAFERLLPVPEQTACVKTRKGATKQHSKVLTYTPLKDSLLEKEKKEKAEKEKYKTKGKKTKECKRKIEDKKTTAKAKKRITQCKIVENKAKRRVLQDIQSTSESDSSFHNICDDDEDDDLENMDGIGTNTCLICTEFGRNNEIWYRCTVCGLWAHAYCTGWDSAEGYICDNC